MTPVEKRFMLHTVHVSIREHRRAFTHQRCASMQSSRIPTVCGWTPNADCLTSGREQRAEQQKVHWETVKQTLKIKNIADSTDSSLSVVFNTRFHFALCELHSDWPTIARARVGHSGLPSLNNKFPFRPVLFLLASRKHVLHSGYKEKYTKKTVS